MSRSLDFVRSTRAFAPAITCATVAVWTMGVVACSAPGDDRVFVPPTADIDTLLPQTQITVAGIERTVHVETFGDENDPLLLVLHGTLGDYRSLGIFEELADRGHHVVMWDRRGNGLSQRIDVSEITDAASLEEVEVIRDEYGTDDPISLIGFESGAALATAYTGAHPDDVAQLVLIEAAPLTGQILSSTHKDVLRHGVLDHSAQALLWQGEVLTPGEHERLDYRAIAIVQNGGIYKDVCTDNPVPLLTWRSGSYFYTALSDVHEPSKGSYSFDFTRGLDEWEGTALLVASTCSAIGSAFQARHHQPLFEDAELVEITGSGHGVLVEQPDAVLEAVEDYLDE